MVKISTPTHAFRGDLRPHLTHSLLLPTCIILVVCGFISPVDAQEKGRISVPATRVSIIPAAGYKIAGTSSMLESELDRSWLVISEESSDFDSVLSERIDPITIAMRGLTLISKSSGPTISDFPSTRLLYEHTEGLIIKRSSYLEVYLAGDSTSTLIVTAIYPDSLTEFLRQSMVKMVITIYWDRTKTLNLFDLLNFEIEPRGGFVLAAMKDGSVMYTRDKTDTLGLPRFFVGTVTSLRGLTTETNRKQEVERILRGTLDPFITPTEIVEFTKIAFDGVQGYETVASSNLLGSDDVLWVYLVVLFHPTSTIAIYGLSLRDGLTENMDDFKEMARTFKRNRISSNAHIDCQKLLNASMYSQAEECFETVLKENPSSVSARIGKAEVLRLRGQYRDAIDLYDRILERERNVEEVFLRRGMAQSRLGKYREAIRDFDQVIKFDESNPDAYFERGLAKEGYGSLPNAAEDYERAIELLPPSPRLHLRLAKVYISLGNHRKAIDILSKAVELDSTDWEIYYLRGGEYVKLPEYLDALKDFTAAISLSPQRSELLVERGAVLLQLGRFSEALKDLERADRRDTTANTVLALSGTVKSYLGKTEAAMVDFAAALRLDSTSHEVYLDRGICLFFTGSFKASAANMRKVVMYGSSPTTRIWLFVAELRAYTREVALEHLLRYRNGVSKVMASPFDLDLIDFALGNLSEGQLLEKAKTADNRTPSVNDVQQGRHLSEAYFTIGLLAYSEGLKTLARKNWQKCLDIGKNGYVYSPLIQAYLSGVWN